ncbi:D-2-hydroxyacid dehydrogenase [Blautia massiliensis]|uniref:D-2-hydroxyacid dehydrogenase n=1 Tax=Blautia TaxID=572511 RepID=UPI0015709691|nr:MULTISPECIES: D-2-hydroxyacid dehydrogenase [Blautia]MCC2725963.1 D-2-hydroxyacid dehydrogenase [Blautia sp. MSK22_86]NSF56858.1 D-2-hydroxyacid dehydrogenase [Blautia massiliensis (ex Durand et al. 2017)]NSK72203.1 D-2-hydroxyacid dehydrogenase [Blautia massiliensis (ex Durand et al. 2017)]
MKIVVLDGYTENPGDLSWKDLEALGENTIYDRTPVELVEERIGDAEIVITNKTPIDKEIFEKCQNIKYVGVLATGYNVVDVNTAAEKGIPVCNIPTYGTTAVAQMVFALLLEICHHVGTHSEAVKMGEWSNNVDWCFWKYPLIELAGKTMGIVGFGRIGKAVGRLAKAFGMNVLAYDEYENEEGKAIADYVTLDDLYAKSDVISLHCPLFPATTGMICKESIAKMKDGVILINTSRGPLINEADLAEALQSKKVYAAGCDVVSTEPIKADNPLLGCYNSILTPHIAWAPKESRQRLMNIAVDNVRNFLNGTTVNAVNMK